ncbi:YceI family protein [Aliikangiella sp. IMCC44653]
MKRIKVNSLSFIIILLFSLSSQAAQKLSLVPQNSTLHFISIKKSSIGELHYFNQLSGGLKKSGEFYVKIDLASVNTAIEIRDKRMQQHLFETDSHPHAIITGRINAAKVNSLKAGESLQLELPLTLSLHGHEKTLQATVRVVRLSSGDILVNSIKPVIVNARDFKLLDGIKKLAELAGLSQIASAVPVGFELVFAVEK